MNDPGTGPQGRSAGSRTWVRWAGLAASFLIVSVTVITLSRLGEEETARPGSESVGDAALARFDGAGPYRAAERDYLDAADQLLAAIEERRDRLSPETLAVLDKNLAIIDRAIGEVRAALEADPGNPGNELMLTTMYRQKIEMLRTVSRLSS